MRQPEIRSVILLTIDCLPFSHLLAGGNPLDICPTINHLAENGVLFTNARSHGVPTQMSFPAIFSSTLPLDCSGYDDGLLNRPKTLAEAMRDSNLTTIGLSTSPWLDHSFSYDRGFDEFHEIFDVDKYWAIFVNIYHKFYADLLAKGFIGDSEFLDTSARILEHCLAALREQCINKKKELLNGSFPYRLELHRHDFHAYKIALDRLLADVRRDPEGSVRRMMAEQIDADIRRFLLGKPTRSPIRSFFVKAADNLLRRVLLQMWRYEYSAPAPYLGNLVVSVIGKAGSRPFFLWTHYLDIHDNTYTSGPIGAPPDVLSFVPKRLLSRHNPANMTITFAIRYVDKAIGRVVHALRTSGLLDSTLVVVCGDHGYSRSSFETMPGNLFDESLHVPLIFYNPGLRPRVITEPCGLIDLAPTVIDLLGKEPCPEFHGRSLVPPIPPGTPVIMESLGPGPCDLRFKAIKMAVVHGRHKLIWREPGYEETCPPGANYLFDLEVDPDERRNLYCDRRYANIVSDLESIVQERSAKLRRQDPRQ